MSRTLLACWLTGWAVWSSAGAVAAQEAAVSEAEAQAELAALSIGIAPFEHVVSPGGQVPDLAAELAARLLLRGAGRTVAPASLAGEDRAEPSAEHVRSLAEQHALDALVVGRVTRLGDRVSIDVRLRDGTTGAVAGTYVAELPLADPAEPVLDRLAAQIVTGALSLSHAPLVAPESPQVAAAVPAVPAPGAAPTTPGDGRKERSPREGRRGRKDREDSRPAGLSLGSLGSDDEPFSIRSDELEVSESAGGRRMSFRGNVEARRGDLVLRTGRLEATYPEGSKRPTLLTARGSVQVRQGEREARCQQADYRESDQKIVCRGDAVLRDGEDELRGESIVFDLERRTVQVEGGTEVALAPRADEGGKRGREDDAGLLGDLSTEGPVTIRAAQLEAVEDDAGGRRIRFEGSVEVAQEDLILRARQIDAIYPPRARQPDRLVARGEVVVVQQGREARCDEAVYLRLERRVDCVGAASLRDGEDQVTGQAIAFDLAAEKLVVTGDTRLVLAPRTREETATP